jgi:hypothetical protein
MINLDLLDNPIHFSKRFHRRVGSTPDVADDARASAL